jgi:rhodanese-related sulfurtransferase
MIIKLATLALFSAVAFAQQVPFPPGQSVPAPYGASSKAKKLTRAEFDALLARPDRILLIDVRRPDEISSIGGFAVYLSIQSDDLQNRLDAIPRDRTIITVSNHAVRAGTAADLLAAHGFRVAGAIGAQIYESEGGKLVKVIPLESEANLNPTPQQR